MTVDHIRLKVPADVRYTPLVRLAATQLAAQSGFDTDRIEDVRVGISEATRILSPGDDPTLSTEFEVAGRAITARLSRRLHTPVVPLDATTERILAAVTTRYVVGGGDGDTATVRVDFDPDDPTDRGDR